jgi:hypothetical protein
MTSWFQETDKSFPSLRVLDDPSLLLPLFFLSHYTQVPNTDRILL